MRLPPPINAFHALTLCLLDETHSAARVAARIRREFQTDVDMIHGKYGDSNILVDDKIVIDGRALAFLGVLPSALKVLEHVGLCVSYLVPSSRKQEPHRRLRLLADP